MSYDQNKASGYSTDRNNRNHDTRNQGYQKRENQGYQKRENQGYQKRDNRGQRPFQQREFRQREDMDCLALKLITTMRRYCSERKLSTMHYARFDHFVMATMIGLKVLPKDVIQQTQARLSKYGYKLLRMDKESYVLLRMAHVDRHWTRLGSKRVRDLPNDIRILEQALEFELDKNIKEDTE